jgi:glutamate:GABA antiporter
MAGQDSSLTTLGTESEQGSPLRRRLKRFDIVLFLACGIVNLDTLGAVSAHGGQGFVWLAILGLIFVIPYGMVVAELGTAFPQEGGHYVWVREAWGKLVAAVTAVFYWIANPIWLGGTLTITAVAVFEEFFIPLPGIAHYIFGGLFISLVIGAACASIDVGKWVMAAGAWLKIVLLSFFSVSVIIYAIQNGVQGLGWGDFSPTAVGFIALVPVLVYNYIGLDLANSAGGEMRNPQRDVPRAISSTTIMIFLLYAIPILAVLIVLPSDRATSLTGFIDTVESVFTVYGGEVTDEGATLDGAGQVLGSLAALGFIGGVFGSGAAWIMGGCRVQAIACLGGGGPRWLGRISDTRGTPIRMNLLSGAIALIFMVATFALTDGDAARYFTVALGLAISTTTIAYCVILPTVLRLRFKYPDIERPYKIPGSTAGLWATTTLSTGIFAFAVFVLLWPGLGIDDPDSALPETFADARWQYELALFVPLAVILALGVVFYALGKRTYVRESDPELLNTPVER